MKKIPKIKWTKGSGIPQQIAEHLAGEIRDNRLKPNEKLASETELCSIYNVSRTAIREAIARLKHEGLIVSKRGIGITVTPWDKRQSFRVDLEKANDPNHISYLYELRIMVGVESAALAAIRHQPEDLARIEHLIQEMANVITQRIDGGVQHRAFHKSIAESSYNPYLIEIERYLHEKLWQIFKQSRRRKLEMDIEVHREHQLMLDTIKSGVPRLAREAALNHLHNSAKRHNIKIHHHIDPLRMAG